MTHHNQLSWKNYWAQGFLTSCAATFTGNYAGNIRSLWETRFAALVDGSRILDIGTGNGAIALLAAEVSQRLDRNFIIDAVDLADIDPAKNLRNESRQLLPRIRFHPGTDVCDCGFDNDSFDLVTGNFALEYSDPARAVRELARITAPAGEHLFVMHSSDSIIVRTAEQELAHLDLLLNKTRLLEHARELIDRVGNISGEKSELATTNPEIDRCRRAFNNAAGKISDVIFESSQSEILRTALGRVSEAYRLSQTPDSKGALAHLQQTGSELGDNATRLSDLCRVAATPADIERLTGLYRQQGFNDICIDKLSEKPVGLLAWIVRARTM